MSDPHVSHEGTVYTDEHILHADSETCSHRGANACVKCDTTRKFADMYPAHCPWASGQPTSPAVESQGNDPTPWRHVCGERVSDPGAFGAPRGGYTFDPRPGYDGYPDRFISTRNGHRPDRTEAVSDPDCAWCAVCMHNWPCPAEQARIERNAS